jgi:hypothetical protein
MKKIMTLLSLMILATSPAFAGTYSAKKIYNALKIEGVYLNPGIAGVSRKQKSVGGLTCIRAVVVYPNAVPTFTCELNN